MTLTSVYVWPLNIPPASNTTDTNIETPESFNTAVNDTEPLAHTTFDDAIETTTQEMPMSSTSHVVQNLMDESATINEVLARPYLIRDIHLTVPGTTLTNSLTLPLVTQTFVDSITLPSSILNDPNKLSKLEYFRYFTADMKIRIETNAQPYMSGKFWIFYNPYPELVSQGKSVQTSQLTSLTSYPGIEYDINQMSNAEISIPFVSYERAFDLENFSDYCQLFISQLTPIRDTTTETKLRMRVYGWFENIKVFGATSKSNLPASYLLNKIKEYNKRLNVSFQINTRKEQKGGIVSTVASGVSTVSKALSNVPVIGSIAGTVGWVSDIVGNVASIFGFSRPTSTEPVCKITNVPAHGYTYSQNVDQSVILASQPDNELGPQTKVFQTEIDEMQFDYISANPGVISIFPYTATSDNSSWLLNIPCSIRPFNYNHSQTIGTHTTAVASPTCAEYLGTLFKFWRGTMCFKISLAKTPFHNGRLILSFDPSNNISDTPFSRLGKAYTTVLDLSENSSVIIKIPYLSKFDYLNTFSLSDDLNKISFGTFSIGAMAPLLGPATVSDAVDVVVWKWVEDVEFAVPYSYFNSCVGDDTSTPTITISLAPNVYGSFDYNLPETIDVTQGQLGGKIYYTIGTGAVGAVSANAASGELTLTTVDTLYGSTYTRYRMRLANGSWSDWFSLTSNLDLTTVVGPFYLIEVDSQLTLNNNVDFQINLMNRDEENVIYFNNPSVDDSFIHSLDCVGEKLVNARALLRIHRGNSTITTSSYRSPFQEHPSLATNVAFLYDNQSYVIALSRMYRFYRGGFSYKIRSSTPVERNIQTSHLNFFDANSGKVVNNTHSHSTFSDLSPFHEVRVPFYSQTYRRVICDERANSGTVDYTFPSVDFTGFNGNDAVLISGDDSLSYGWLVGPPTIVFVK